jgi:hypothetical protein
VAPASGRHQLLSVAMRRIPYRNIDIAPATQMRAKSMKVSVP